MKNTILLIYIFSVQSLLGQQILEQQKTPLVTTQSISSSFIETKVDFHLYIPDAYEKDTTNYFPAIYWFHGSGGWPPGVLNMLANRFSSNLVGVVMV